MNRWMDRYFIRYLDGWMDVWMNRWMDRYSVRYLDGWVESYSVTWWMIAIHMMDDRLIFS